MLFSQETPNHSPLLQVETDYCLLLALPCGRDQEDVVSQTESLKAAFITYLQAKQAAGIINVPNPGSNQVGPLSHPYPTLVHTARTSLGQGWRADPARSSQRRWVMATSCPSWKEGEWGWGGIDLEL